MSKLIVTILSGGSGSRLWPLSRDNHPKPFIRLSDNQSLLQKAYLRGAELPYVKEVLTVTNRELVFLTHDHYEEVKKPIHHRLILEPAGRNTAAAIAVAALDIRKRDGEDALMSDDLLSLLSSEADGNQDWQPPEDTSAWAETPEAFLPDSSPDLFTDAQFSPFEDEQSSAEPQEAGIEDIPDFGTRSRVTIEKRSSPYGQYRISFSSDAAGLVTDQVNDDSFFNKDAPTIRVDFLDDKNARSRWRLLSKLHGQLSESMAVPEDEAHNLDTIERDFSSSDISASGEQVALYLGRMRVIASRG